MVGEGGGLCGVPHEMFGGGVRFSKPGLYFRPGIRIHTGFQTFKTRRLKLIPISDPKGSKN